MKKMLFVLLLVAVVVGFYRGWFAFSSHGRDESNKSTVSLTVDSDKMKEDARKAKDNTTELGDRARVKVTSTDR